MVMSISDIELMCFLRWCNYIDRVDLLTVFRENTISDLEIRGLIRLKGEYGVYILTGRGHQLLDRHVPDLPPPAKLSYSASDIRRRTRVAKMTMTAYRAGLSVFQSDMRGLNADRTFFLTSCSRKVGYNPWGSARVASVLRLGDALYGMHYVCPGVGKLALRDEMRIFNNNTAQLGVERQGLIFAGESYGEVLSELTDLGKPSKSTSVRYGEAYGMLSTPIHILSCDAVGAEQLNVLSQPDYRTRLTRAILKSRYTPPLEGHSEWDAMYEGSPFVLAVDMELKRVKAAIRSARKVGYPSICIAGLKEQVDTVLTPRYGDDGYARVFTVRDEILRALGDVGLYTPARGQYITKKGDVIDAPPIQAARKVGRLRRG